MYGSPDAVKFSTTSGLLAVLDHSHITGTSIDLINSDVKGKIAKLKTVASPNVGDINISLGPPGSPIATPANVQVTETGGTVSFTGAGLKVKGVAATMKALGANIKVNNGTGSLGSLSLYSGVSVEAN